MPFQGISLTDPFFVFFTYENNAFHKKDDIIFIRKK